MLNQFTKFLVGDVSRFIDPQRVDGEARTVTGSVVNTARELEAVARGKPSRKRRTPAIDNQDESLPNAQQRLEFAFGERLALDVAYRPISQQQTIIPLLEEDNVIRQYKIVALRSGHSGIVGNILIPQSTAEHRRIYVNFRGTDSQNSASLHVDLEHCVGEESFHKCFSAIMGQINGLIGEMAGNTDAPIQLIVSGHSMGSALSQYFLNGAMLSAALSLPIDLSREEVDEATPDLIIDYQRHFANYLHQQYGIARDSVSCGNTPHFAKITTFRINSWGTVGVSHEMASLSNLLTDVLNANGKTVIGRFGNNKLDIITKNGFANCLADCSGDIAYLLIEDQHLELNRSAVAGLLTGVTTGLLIGGIPGLLVGGATAAYHSLRPLCLAHGNTHFGSYGELLPGKTYEYIHNSTPAGRRKIRDIASDKSTLMQQPIIHQAKAFLKQSGHAGSKLKEKAAMGVVAAIQKYDQVTQKPEKSEKSAKKARRI